MAPLSRKDYKEQVDERGRWKFGGRRLGGFIWEEDLKLELERPVS